MDEIYAKISKFNSLHFKCSVQSSIDKTDLWRNHSTGIISEDSSQVPAEKLSTWLDTEWRNTDNGPESLVMRLVWAQVDTSERQLSLSQPVKQGVLDKFGLNLAFDYFSTSVNGVDELPRLVTSAASQRSYAFCYMPKLGAIWSHQSFRPPSAREGATYGIVLVASEKDSGSEKPGQAPPSKSPKDLKHLKSLKKLLSGPWNTTLPGHPMFPALIFGLQLGREINVTQESIKPMIHVAEKSTGHHLFHTRRPENVAAGDLGDLSAKMSGAATKLAGVQRKARTMEALMEFVLGILDRHAQESRGLEGDSLLRHHVKVLQQRLKMQVLDTDFTLKRVQIQIQALVNLITRSDSMNNYHVAVASHRDALSMKTLAFVTMFFLPGSFIAALFSTNCFDWDSLKPGKSSIGVRPTPQFKLYWAITIPLTVLTFVLYFIWLRVEKRTRMKTTKDRKGGDNGVSSDHGSDEDLLGDKPRVDRSRASVYFA